MLCTSGLFSPYASGQVPFRSRGRLKPASRLQRKAETKSLAFIYAVGGNAVCHGLLPDRFIK